MSLPGSCGRGFGFGAEACRPGSAALWIVVRSSASASESFFPCGALGVNPGGRAGNRRFRPSWGRLLPPLIGDRLGDYFGQFFTRNPTSSGTRHYAASGNEALVPAPVGDQVGLGEWHRYRRGLLNTEQPRHGERDVDPADTDSQGRGGPDSQCPKDHHRGGTRQTGILADGVNGRESPRGTAAASDRTEARSRSGARLDSGGRSPPPAGLGRSRGMRVGRGACRLFNYNLLGRAYPDRRGLAFRGSLAGGFPHALTAILCGPPSADRRVVGPRPLGASAATGSRQSRRIRTPQWPAASEWA